MSNIAFIYPGQGAQKCGMGADFYENSASVRKLFDEAGIAVRTGLQCAPLAHEFAGTYPAGTIRFSVSYFTTEQDFQGLISALDYIEENI